MQVAIQDGAGNYWGGATFNQAAIFYNAAAGTTAAWTYATATLAGQLTDGHTYTITARSTDAAGNTGTTHPHLRLRHHPADSHERDLDEGRTAPTRPGR